MQLSVTATSSVPPDQVAAIERRLEATAHAAGDRLRRLHVTLRSEGEAGAPTFVADALAFLEDRIVPAHATGRTPSEAGEALAGELVRRLSQSGG